jgi:hypothetical protein
MHSLRMRLLALWLMLATSAAATGFVLFEFYRQSANSQIVRAEDLVANSLCNGTGNLQTRIREIFSRNRESAA